MKKFYLFLFFAFSISGTSQIVNIPDPAFKAKLVDANCGCAVNSADQYIAVDSNQDGEIQYSEALAVAGLSVQFSGIQSLVGIEAFTNLKTLNCQNNLLTELDVSALTSLRRLVCRENSINDLGELSPLIVLEELLCDNNQLTYLDVADLTNLITVYCGSNQITELDFTASESLVYLNCQYNNLTSLNVSGLAELNYLNASINSLQTINTEGLQSINQIHLQNNQLQNFIGLYSSGFVTLSLDYNPVTFIDLTNLSNSTTTIQCALCSNLTTLLIKNGSTENVQISGAPLQYVCTDESEANSVQLLLNNYQTGFNLNSYCSFTPGGLFFTVDGTIKIDNEDNGCDSSDFSYPLTKLSVTDGTNTGNFYSDNNGVYNLSLVASTHTITPLLEIPSYYTISPPTLVVSFPSDASPFSQNFCITPNGPHDDLSILIIPTRPARPGFNSEYKLILKNKGTTMQSGTFSLVFQDSYIDVITVTPTFASSTDNLLTWDFSNLLPQQSLEYDLTFNLNSPMEVPALNGGDQLNFTATVILNSDEMQSDNTFGLKQIVVNSFDPNDKTCLQGTTISPSMVGDYVHYVIRFENTGTFPAENIVVKDMIDLTKFDISSLVPLNASHNFETRINGYKVEFIFENIMLPFDDATNDGYVAFKIKTLPTLSIGETFSNSASIYFDYNFPIVTDPAITSIQNLGKADFDFARYFTIYPNPAASVLNLKAVNDARIKSIAIYNMLGQIVIAIPNAQDVNAIDVSQLKTGSYFIKINSDKGATNAKFVRN